MIIYGYIIFTVNLLKPLPRTQDLTRILNAFLGRSRYAFKLVGDAKRLPLMNAERVIRKDLHPLDSL